jgi:hypothetical protein
MVRLRRSTAWKLSMLGAVVALLVASASASASVCGALRAGPTASRLRAAIEDVSCATARYAATDSAGATLAGLKVIEAGDGYVGVYHAVNAGRFALYVGSSTDLVHWRRRATLDRDASQGTITSLPDGGFLVAYEWGNTLDLLPLLDLSPVTALPVDGLRAVLDAAPRIRIRFRYYRSLRRLLAGIPARQFTVPRTLAKTAEGTPSFTTASIARDTPLLPLSESTIEIGMHYFADLNGDGFPDADRQATGRLVDFNTWSANDAPTLNASFANLPPAGRHPPYARAPRGNYGDRDLAVLEGEAFQVHEAQYVRNDFGSWRPFLLDVSLQTLAPLFVRTRLGSSSFGNPTVTPLIAPDGQPAVFVSMFVFREGAAPGEAGALVYYRALGS